VIRTRRGKGNGGYGNGNGYGYGLRERIRNSGNCRRSVCAPAIVMLLCHNGPQTWPSYACIVELVAAVAEWRSLGSP